MLRRLLLRRPRRVAPAPGRPTSPLPPPSPGPCSPRATPRCLKTVDPPPSPPPPPPLPLPIRVHIATFNAAGLCPRAGELLPRAFCGFGGGGGGGGGEEGGGGGEGGGSSGEEGAGGGKGGGVRKHRPSALGKTDNDGGESAGRYWTEAREQTPDDGADDDAGDDKRRRVLPPSPGRRASPPDLVVVCTQETGGRSTAGWERCVLRSLREHAIAASAEEVEAAGAAAASKAALAEEAAGRPTQGEPPFGAAARRRPKTTPPPPSRLLLPPPSYSVVARRTLRGGGMVTHTAAYAASSLRVAAPTRSAAVATGLFNVLGNKGAAAVALSVARRPWPALPPLALPAAAAQGSAWRGDRRGAAGGGGGGYFGAAAKAGRTSSWGPLLGCGGGGWGEGGADGDDAAAPAAARAPAARLVFVGAHLAAHEGPAFVARRNADAARIARGVARAFGLLSLAENRGQEEEEGEEEDDQGGGEGPAALLLLPPRAAGAGGAFSASACLPPFLRGAFRGRGCRVAPAATGKPRPPALAPAVVFWAGDLNYRAEGGVVAEGGRRQQEREGAAAAPPPRTAAAAATAGTAREDRGEGAEGHPSRATAVHWASLARAADELTRERGRGGGCKALAALREAPLAFPPTFKLERRAAAAGEPCPPPPYSLLWAILTCRGRPRARRTDSSKALLLALGDAATGAAAAAADRAGGRRKEGARPFSGKRAPSWTDRVLWGVEGGCDGPLRVRQLYYGAVQADAGQEADPGSVVERSDHRAVVAGFLVSPAPAAF